MLAEPYNRCGLFVQQGAVILTLQKVRGHYSIF